MLGQATCIGQNLLFLPKILFRRKTSHSMTKYIASVTPWGFFSTSSLFIFWIMWFKTLVWIFIQNRYRSTYGNKSTSLDSIMLLWHLVFTTSFLFSTRIISSYRQFFISSFKIDILVVISFLVRLFRQRSPISHLD